MRQLLSDLRFALRQTVRHPAFAVAAIATLTIGIGANTAVFSLLNGIWIRPLPFPAQDRLVHVNTTAPKRGRDVVGVSLPDFIDWRARGQSFERMAAFRMTRGVLSGQEEARRIAATLVSEDLFGVLGVRPVLGRIFLDDEGRPGGEPVLIISHTLWRDGFGGDLAVVGRQMRYDGRLHTIVGVMPQGFAFPDQAEVWLPLLTDVPASERSNHMYDVVARMKPGVTVAQARRQLVDVGRQLAREYPDTNSDVEVTVTPLRTYLVGAEPTGFALLMGAVGLVLLVACANLASLLLARVSGRSREIAVRLALGASRWRVVRLVLVESGVLAAAGGVLGMLVGTWARDAFVAVQPFPLPVWLHFDTDIRVALFAAGITALTALAFGTVPALRASRSAPGPSLGHGRSSPASASSSRLRNALVIVQVCLAVTLLAGAGLLMRSVLAALAVDPGFRTDHLLTLRIDLPQRPYETDEQIRSFFDEAVARTRRLPGVRGAAAVSFLPLGGRDWGQSFSVEGAPAVPKGEGPIANNRTVTADYFDVMGIPLLDGRHFDERDGAAGTPLVVIVNQALAERHWPGASAVGRRIRLGDALLTIVGVVGNVRHDSLTAGVREGVYLPHAEQPMRRMALVVHTSTDPAALAGPIREQIAALDRGLPVFDVRTMEDVVGRSLSIYHIASWLVGGFAVAAMLLAALGVAGLVSYTVAQRTREIAIRMAMGATARQVVMRVSRQGLTQVAIGGALGLAGGAGLTVALRTMLHGLQSVEPGVLASVAAILAAAAALACYLPVRRATRVSPVVALRDE